MTLNTKGYSSAPSYTETPAVLLFDKATGTFAGLKDPTNPQVPMPFVKSNSVGTPTLVVQKGDGTQVLTQVPNTKGNANTIVLMGHSRMANNGGQASAANPNIMRNGYFSSTMQQLGWPVTIMDNIAVTGVNLASVITNQLPLLQAMNPLPECVGLEIGYNDFNGGGTAAALIPAMLGLLSSIQDIVPKLILFADAPGHLAGSALQQQRVWNDWLRMWANSQPRSRVLFVDTAQALTDPTDGTMLAALSNESSPNQTHVNCDGADYVTDLCLADMAAFLPGSPQFTCSHTADLQLIPNPGLTGNNANNVNGTSIGTGITGTGPSYWSISRAGTATATTATIDRSAATYAPKKRAGKLLQIACSFAANWDTIYVGLSNNVPIRNWVANTALAMWVRVRPTVPNGCQYLVTTNGTTANVADTTAGWSTTIGATVTDGGVTYTVVPSIDFGDQVYLEAEVYGGGFTGPAGCYLSLKQYTSGYAVVGSASTGGYFDSSSGKMPSNWPTKQILRTPPITLSSLMTSNGFLNPYLSIQGNAGVTGTVEMARCELRKVGA